MVLPKAYNTRADEQWRILKHFLVFALPVKNKRVVDLGCGHCDILFRIADSGAEFCLGIDSDKELVDKIERTHKFANLEVRNRNIDDFIGYNDEQYDISICFSVLPYLDMPNDVLAWMRDHSKLALIECQYYGDGPGFPTISNDKDMMQWLKSMQWEVVQIVGRTAVKDRGMTRTIWACYGDLSER